MFVKIEHIMFFVIAGILGGLLLFVIFLVQPASKTAQPVQMSINAEPFQNRLQRIENDIAALSQNQNTQASTAADLKTQLSSTAKTVKGKTVLAISSTQGGSFTTTSQNYSPMGMYTNVNCPVACYLWIDFYSSSKNQTQPPGNPGYFNSYNAFIDGADRSIFSQASFPFAGSGTPVSINAAVAVSSGFHTVDVRAKTTGGTLESSASYLQVMAIEQ